jgi:hypothetical protein
VVDAEKFAESAHRVTPVDAPPARQLVAQAGAEIRTQQGA